MAPATDAMDDGVHSGSESRRRSCSEVVRAVINEEDSDWVR
jgi:hypothetical protein